MLAYRSITCFRGAHSSNKYITKFHFFCIRVFFFFLSLFLMPITLLYYSAQELTENRLGRGGVEEENGATVVLH